MKRPSMPRILCVDDEPQLLKSLRLHLRKHYEVHTATSGAEGLELIGQIKHIAIVLSDMRMPQMDGATFLSTVQQRSPDTVRMLLTGETNIELASKAVNEGQIFRFLTKPCPPDQLLLSFKAAMEHHRLITAEKVLLQKTLLGSIRALVDVLAINNPIAFSCARKIRGYALELAKVAGVSLCWPVEAAALLSQIGYVSLPAETMEKIYQGESLNREEETLVSGAPKVAEQLLRNIPRLEQVLEILHAIDSPLWRNGTDLTQSVPMGARILKISIDYDRFKTRHGSVQIALDTLCSRERDYDEKLLEKFVKLRDADETGKEIKEMPLRSVTLGMVLIDEVRSKNDVLIVGRNFEVTDTFLERVRRLDAGLLDKMVKVIVRDPVVEAV